ncbi:MAG: GyrI-like domain-containing protein [Alphaproteobacteria bacterium]|jgi:effector-binding domain-containing protein|nr:GyrI-like domain-containing protein [Alphaproteobacteria bacterium]
MSNYKINIDGIVETEDFYLIGYMRFSNMKKDFKDVMTKDYTKLGEYAPNLKIAAPMVAVYKAMNMETMDVYSLHALPVEPTEETAKECVKVLDEKGGMWAIIPPYEAALKVTLEGSYDNLMEAWGKAYEFIKENELVTDEYASPWESYKVHPGMAAGDDSKLVTEIFIPLIPMEEEE